jgi:hypothetical protein
MSNKVMIMLFTLLFVCLAFEGFVVGGELTKFSTDVDALLLLSAVRILGTNLAAKRYMPISFVRTHWHVP